MKVNINVIYDFIVYSLILITFYLRYPSLFYLSISTSFLIILPLVSLLISGLYSNLKTFVSGIIITIISILYLWPYLSNVGEFAGIAYFTEIIVLILIGLVPFVVEVPIALIFIYLSPPSSLSTAIGSIPLIFISLLFTAYVRGIILPLLYGGRTLFLEIELRAKQSKVTFSLQKSAERKY